MKTVTRREYNREKNRLIELLKERTKVKDIYDHIWFVDYTNGDDPVHMKVNFSAMGAMEPIEATRYAECIKEAADLAMNFKYNGFMIQSDYLVGYKINIMED